jgi:hypothetical protein
VADGKKHWTGHRKDREEEEDEENGVSPPTAESLNSTSETPSNMAAPVG